MTLAVGTTNGRLQIRGLVCGYARPIRGTRLLLMLQAYIDDSGSGNPPALVLGGVLSTAEQWETFSDQWQDALAGPPKLDYFKMKEAHRLNGQFQGWSPEDRDGRLWELLTVLKRHTQLRLAAVVPHELYQLGSFGALSPRLKNPYVLAFYSVMILMASYQYVDKSREPVDFIFDEQRHDSTNALLAYEYFVETAPRSIKRLLGGRPIHRDDRLVLPLQAADLVAWQTRRYYMQKAHGVEYDNWVWRSLATVPAIKWEITPEMLIGVLRDLQKSARPAR